MTPRRVWLRRRHGGAGEGNGAAAGQDPGRGRRARHGRDCASHPGARRSPGRGRDRGPARRRRRCGGATRCRADRPPHAGPRRARAHGAAQGAPDGPARGRLDGVRLGRLRRGGNEEGCGRFHREALLARGAAHPRGQGPRIEPAHRGEPSAQEPDGLGRRCRGDRRRERGLETRARVRGEGGCHGGSRARGGRERNGKGAGRPRTRARSTSGGFESLWDPFQEWLARPSHRPEAPHGEPWATYSGRYTPSAGAGIMLVASR